MTVGEFWFDNFDHVEWYKNTYPFLKELFFPPSLEMVLTFYETDMREINLTPLSSFYNNYEFLFSYFIANYPAQNDPNRFVGRGFIQRLIDGFPKALRETQKDLKPITDIFTGLGDIVSGIGSAVKNFWFIIIPITLFIIFLYFRK